MNVIVITLDGARIDRILKSDIIQSLSKKGCSFSNMITYAPYTIGSMHAIFSGEYGFRTGVNSYWASIKFKKQQYKTLTEYLHDYDYKTFGDIINTLIIPHQGFENLQIHNEDKDDLLAKHKNILNQIKDRELKGDNIFLYLHYSSIHTNIKKNVLKKFDNFSNEYFENKNENENNYDKYFKNAENYIKEIYEHCEKLDLLKDTLFVLLSDHGISIGEKFGERAYGAYCYDYTIKTYALFLKNGLIPSKIIKNQVRTIDIMPTILDILKINLDSKYNKISGKSLTTFFDNNNEDRTAITETGNPLQSGKPPKEPNVISIRKKNWKLILNLHNGTREIYNLKEDPNEENNLINIEKNIEEDLFEELINIHPSVNL